MSSRVIERREARKWRSRPTTRGSRLARALDVANADVVASALESVSVRIAFASCALSSVGFGYKVRFRARAIVSGIPFERGI